MSPPTLSVLCVFGSLRFKCPCRGSLAEPALRVILSLCEIFPTFCVDFQAAKTAEFRRSRKSPPSLSVLCVFAFQMPFDCGCAALVSAFFYHSSPPGIRWLAQSRSFDVNSVIVSILLGIILLVAGRRLFWLFVAAVGFLYGLNFAPMINAMVGK